MYDISVNYGYMKGIAMSVPEVIKNHAPNQFGACEVRTINGHYYVYRISSKWDAVKKKARKVTGKSIGKITEKDGFIPNVNGLRLIEEQRSAVAASGTVTVRNYGAYETLRQLTPDMEGQLREYFPDIFREINTLSLIRVIDRAPTKFIRNMYLSSDMRDLYPDIALSDVSVRKFISRLGTRQSDIYRFMQASIAPGTTLLFDGTVFFARMDDTLSTTGYNPEHSQNPQVRLLYIFDRDSHKPVFYTVLQGSVVDKAAFIDTVRSSGCKDCIVIADKGFYSKPNVSALMDAGLKYILPLQSNTKNVPFSFYLNQDDSKFDGVFSYKHRAIYYAKTKSGVKGNYIYTFRDDMRRARQRGLFVELAEKNYGEDVPKPLDVNHQNRFGYFSFCSDIDADPQRIYLDYKARWNIEECFDYLKNDVTARASFAHSDEFLRGVAFLNHVSMLYYYGLINALRRAKLDEDYSPADILKLTSNVWKVDTGDGQGYKVTGLQKEAKMILEKIEVELST